MKYGGEEHGKDKLQKSQFKSHISALVLLHDKHIKQCSQFRSFTVNSLFPRISKGLDFATLYILSCVSFVALEDKSVTALKAATDRLHFPSDLFLTVLRCRDVTARRNGSISKARRELCSNFTRRDYISSCGSGGN